MIPFSAALPFFVALSLLLLLSPSDTQARLILLRPDEQGGRDPVQTEHSYPPHAGIKGKKKKTETAVRVNLTIGVMSRCPDAIAAESALTPVIDRINEKIRLEFSYIGSLDEEEEYGVKCMHGTQECAGNIQQLCVQHILRPSRAGKDFDLSPSSAQRKVWDFVGCQDYDGASSIGSPSLAKSCLSTIKGPRWIEDGVKECVEGKKGRQLLQESVQQSKKLGLRNSATVQLEGKTICIRDDGVWKACEGGHETADFVKQIEEAWERKRASGLSD